MLNNAYNIGVGSTIEVVIDILNILNNAYNIGVGSTIEVVIDILNILNNAYNIGVGSTIEVVIEQRATLLKTLHVRPEAVRIVRVRVVLVR